MTQPGATPTEPQTPLAKLIWERDEGRESELWTALMSCNYCDHRLLEHDQVAFRCHLCSCDQSHRGLSAYADEHLIALGKALKEAGEA